MDGVLFRLKVCVIAICNQLEYVIQWKLSRLCYMTFPLEPMTGFDPDGLLLEAIKDG